jgi:hypothetical protein
MNSVTQKIWYDFLQMTDIEPPVENKSKDKNCWLCGGSVNNKSWAVKDAITNTFTDVGLISENSSNSVCCACVALMKKESWEKACKKHGYSPYFPLKENKKPCMSNWMFYSHVFTSGKWLMPSRSEIEKILLNPPEPPFSIVITVSGKKHLIFRSKISYSKSDFFVQFEEQSISVNLKKFKDVHDIVKYAYENGVSKESLLSGNYNHLVILKIGLKKWGEIENKLRKIREQQRNLLSLSCFVVQNDSNV